MTQNLYLLNILPWKSIP